MGWALDEFSSIATLGREGFVTAMIRIDDNAYRQVHTAIDEHDEQRLGEFLLFEQLIVRFLDLESTGRR